MNSRNRPSRTLAAHEHERGATLILVTVLLVVMLVGGLALVALTSGELTGARGFRTRETTEACASAGLQKMRSLIPDTTSATNVSSSVSIYGGNNLTYRGGHFASSTATSAAVEVLDETMYDSTSLYDGQRITNVITGGNPSGLAGVRVMALHSTCGGPGSGESEMETIFRFGVPAE